jgi:uncharacterized protein Yka (UPF0111/DUF47 family)
LLALFDEAGENAHATSGLLRDLLAVFPDPSDLGPRIRACEHEGDRIAHEILRRLARRGSRRARMDVTDVYALTMAIDDIVDHAEEAADQLGLYGVEAPMEQAEQIAAVLVSCAEQVAAALRGLRTGADLSANLVEIHRLENEGDRLQRAALATLFATGVDPMVLIRWKDIFDTLEDAVDACETVANVLEGISIKRAHR